MHLPQKKLVFSLDICITVQFCNSIDVCFCVLSQFCANKDLRLEKIDADLHEIDKMIQLCMSDFELGVCEAELKERRKKELLAVS